MRDQQGYRALAFLFLASAAWASGIAQQISRDSSEKLSNVQLLASRNQFPEADRELRDILASGFSSTEAHFLLAYVLLREHHPTESLAEYNIAAHLRTPTAAEWISIASDYILLKDLADAQKWLLIAAAQEPSNAEVWYLLGRTQYNLNNDEGARRSFTRCLELRPRDVRAKYNLGLAYERIDRKADAIAAYETAIAWQSSLGKPDAQPYLNLGTLLFQEGKSAEALEPLQQAVRFGSENALASQQLGLVFEALGRYNDAVSALRQASVLAPEASQPHFFLGRVLRRMGRTSEAAEEFATVSKLLGAHSNASIPNTP